MRRRRPLLDGWLPRSDVFHGLNQRLPRKRPRRSVVTFHDLFVLTAEYSSPGFRLRFEQQARHAAENSDLIISVSEFTARQVERHDELRRLGPDLLSPSFDAGEAVRRLRALGDAEVGDALLDQRAMAGVGNVFKSEVLFVCRLFPFRTVSTLSDEEVERLVAEARRLLGENVIDASRAGAAEWGGYRRTTRRTDPAARLWVYGRGGAPCRVCGTAIEYRKQGPDARGTYWCPACQRAPTPGR
jgi:endonuclease-8